MATIEEKLVGVESNLAGAKQRELLIASQEITLASTELAIADNLIEVAELVIEEQTAVVQGLEQELLAQESRADAAESDLAIAQAKANFHANSNALNMAQAWYWRRLSRDTAFRIVFRGLFDYARTIDLLRGTDLMGVLEQLNVQSVEQAQVALEIFELMLFDQEVAQEYNIILSEADDTPGFRIGDKISLGAIPPPELGVAVGTFEDAIVLDDREGDEYWVWALELLNGDGDSVDHFHPSLRDRPTTRDLLPSYLTSAHTRIRVRATGVR